MAVIDHKQSRCDGALQLIVQLCRLAFEGLGRVRTSPPTLAGDGWRTAGAKHSARLLEGRAELGLELLVHHGILLGEDGCEALAKRLRVRPARTQQRQAAFHCLPRPCAVARLGREGLWEQLQLLEGRRADAPLRERCAAVVHEGGQEAGEVLELVIDLLGAPMEGGMGRVTLADASAGCLQSPLQAPSGERGHCKRVRVGRSRHLLHPRVRRRSASR